MVETSQNNTKRGVKDKVKKLIGKRKEEKEMKIVLFFKLIINTIIPLFINKSR